MRYTASHKNHTHQRIVNVASRLFKEQGIDATGLATVMTEANLTNGAFYAHFKSKEELVETVIADQLQLQLKRFQEVPKDVSGLKLIVQTYLTTEHRDHCGDGCPSAALLDEIGRRPQTTKQAYSAGVLNIIENLQEHLPSDGEKQAKSLVLALMSLLIGTMQLSRAVADHELSDTVLASGKAAALTLIDTY
jgi:TetR/AcrR family transcriptional repressor of nem operon